MSSGVLFFSPLDLPPSRRGRNWVHAAVVAAVLYGLAIAAVAVWAQRSARVSPAPHPVSVTQWVEIAPPPPAEPARIALPKSRARAAPPPSAARAGKVIQAPPEAVADFGDAMVAGSGTAYAGGFTHAAGTSDHAASHPAARPGGAEGGTGGDPSGDLARAPTLAGSAVWDCPFPAEADDQGVDHAVVTLEVEVGVNGRALSASPANNPGHGFAREARRCALGKRWRPGLDRTGRAVQTVTAIDVRFDR